MNQKIMKNKLMLITWIKKLHNFIHTMIETVFPKREPGVGLMPLAYEYKPDTYAGINYFVKYKDQLVKKMVWRFKYYLDPHALTWCTYILYDELIADVSDRISSTPFGASIPLLHCPSSTYFKGAKKFDHMKEMTEMIGNFQNTGEPFFISCTHAILPNIGAHIATARAQHTGTRKERLEWAKQRFFISEKFENYLKEKSGELCYQRTIYCIDDVITTGASLDAITKLFSSKFNISVKSFCLCH